MPPSWTPVDELPLHSTVPAHAPFFGGCLSPPSVFPSFYLPTHLSLCAVIPYAFPYALPCAKTPSDLFNRRSSIPPLPRPPTNCTHFAATRGSGFEYRRLCIASSMLYSFEWSGSSNTKEDLERCTKPYESSSYTSLGADAEFSLLGELLELHAEV